MSEQPWLSIVGIAALAYVAAFFIHSPQSPFAPKPPLQRVRRAFR